MSHNIIVRLISTTETVVSTINCGLRISVQCFSTRFINLISTFVVYHIAIHFSKC